MATGEQDTALNAKTDNAEVTADITNQADTEPIKASPWVIAKAHHKVKKNAGKTSKRAAGGGKTRKKGKARQDHEATAELDGDEAPTSPTDSDPDSSTVHQRGPASSSGDVVHGGHTKQGSGKKDRRDSHKLQDTLDTYDDEVTPTVNGMRHFGISKGVISRAIVRFSAPPEPQPLAVCFHFPGTFLTHKYVLEMVRERLKPMTEARVTTIQFVDRNTIHGTQGLDNRWLVTLNGEEAREYMLRHGLTLFNKKIKLRRYDDVLMEEYVEYQHYEQMQNKLFVRSKEEQTAGENQDQGGEELENGHGSGPPTTPEPPHVA